MTREQVNAAVERLGNLLPEVGIPLADKLAMRTVLDALVAAQAELKRLRDGEGWATRAGRAEDALREARRDSERLDAAHSIFSTRGIDALREPFQCHRTDIRAALDEMIRREKESTR